MVWEEVEFEMETDEEEQPSGPRKQRSARSRSKDGDMNDRSISEKRKPLKRKRGSRSIEKEQLEISDRKRGDGADRKRSRAEEDERIAGKQKKVRSSLKDNERGKSPKVPKKRKGAPSIDHEEEPDEDKTSEEMDDEDLSFEMDESSFELAEEEGSDQKKTAKKEPLSEGMKRRLMRDSREIMTLKKELLEVKGELRAFENEVEYLEKEMEKIRSEREDLDEDLNKKAAIINALEKKLARTQKDFEGYKGRINQEIERKAIMKMKGMVLGIIEILDNFDRALSEGKKYEMNEGLSHMMDGMDSIRKAHTKLLQDNNIESIEPGREQFDPNLHEAVEVLHDTSWNDNTIIRVESKGYLLDGKVLRPAKVTVSKGGEPWPKPDKKPKVDDEDKMREDEEELLEDLSELDDLEEIEDDE